MFEPFFVGNLMAALGEWGTARCVVGLVILALTVMEFVAACGGIIQLALRR